MRKIFLTVFALLFFVQTCFASLGFDRVDNRLSCGTSDTYFTENGAVTISLWMYARTDGLAGAGRILGRFNVGAGGTVGPGFRTAATQALRFTVAGSTTLVRLTNNSVYTLNAWNHILVTWTGSTTATTVHIYVNGTEATYATTTNGATPTNNATGTTFIGISDDNSAAFDGFIDDLAVWNVVLDTNDILQLSQSRVKRLPLQVKPSSLKAYWALDECGDATACTQTFFDQSGNGNNCTPSNISIMTAITTAISYP